MSAPKTAALQAAIIKVLADKVTAANELSKAAVLTELDPGDRLNATHDGRSVATVSVAKGRTTAKVTDEDRFARWVNDHYPSEVEHKPVVRGSFVNAVLEQSKKAGEPCGPGGELDVPGIEVGAGDPYVTIRPAADAEQIVGDMFRAGRIDVDGTLRKIEAGA